MILSRNMLKWVGESRHPCQTVTVVRNQSLMLLLKRTALMPLSERFFMTWIRLVPIYFFRVTYKAACQTLSKALKFMKTWFRSCWCWRYFSQRIRRLKICSVVLLPALKPACSSAMIVSACRTLKRVKREDVEETKTEDANESQARGH